MAGTSGNWALGCRLVTPSAINLPERMCGIAEGRLSIAIWICPAIRSSSIGPLPRYGMWVAKIPARLLNSSVERCPVEPLPGEP